MSCPQNMNFWIKTKVNFASPENQLHTYVKTPRENRRLQNQNKIYQGSAKFKRSQKNWDLKAIHSFTFQNKSHVKLFWLMHDYLILFQWFFHICHSNISHCPWKLLKSSFNTKAIHFEEDWYFSYHTLSCTMYLITYKLWHSKAMVLQFSKHFIFSSVGITSLAHWNGSAKSNWPWGNTLDPIWTTSLHQFSKFYPI